MNIDTLLSMTSLFLMLFAIIGVAWWAFAPSRRKRFNDDAMLPFADETELEKHEKVIHPDSDEQR